MTDYQNELVMEHLDLVNWVIRTRISVPNRPLLTYDDFYAIGCEAICRAALKYQADSGEFAPFACRYILEDEIVQFVIIYCFWVIHFGHLLFAEPFANSLDDSSNALRLFRQAEESIVPVRKRKNSVR